MDRNDFIYNSLFIFAITVIIFEGFGIKILYLLFGTALMAVSCLYFFRERYIHRDDKLTITVLFWIVYHVVYALANMSTSVLYTCFQHIGIVEFFWMIYKIRKTNLNRDIIKKYLMFLHFCSLLYLMIIVFRFPSLKTSYEYLIYVGLSTLPFVLNEYGFLEKIKLVILCALWAFIAYQIGARAQIISFVLYILVYFGILILFRKGKKVPNILFIVYYVALNIFPMLYTYLGQSYYRSYLDGLAIQLTGSRFFSGRDILWNYVYSRTNSTFLKIFGIGFKATSDFVKSDKSLHNLFVTVFSEGGLLLVVILGFLLYEVWKRLNESSSSLAKFIMAFFIVFLYKQSFDVSLIENNLWIAFPVWLVLGLGVMDSNEESNNL